MVAKYIKTYTVGCGDMDINYRLNKISVAKFFQETFARNCAKYKLAAFDVCEQNLTWVISDLRIDILNNMPFWSEDFQVEMWISEVTKLRTYADFKIYYKNELIAKGDSCWFLIDISTRRPVKSIDIVSCFQTEDEKVFEEHSKQMYQADGEKISEKLHQVTVRDLDFNYHVNNLSYIGLALETVPHEYLDKFVVTSYKVKFVKEAYLDDVLVCEFYSQNGEFLSRIYNQKDNTDVCFVLSKYEDKPILGRNPREAGVTFE